MAPNSKRTHHMTGLPDAGRFGIAETVSQMKKRRLSDGSNSPGQSESGTAHEKGVSPLGLSQLDGWQVANSKSSRKKKNKAFREDNHTTGTALHFNDRLANPILIKDLQDLVLYALTDGIAPTWVAVKNGKQIEQIVVLMVPGLDREMLESLASSVADELEMTGAPTNDRKTNEDSILAFNDVENGDDIPEPAIMSRPIREQIMQSIISVRAPGDSKFGKVHSPLQAMMITPTLTTKEKKNGKTPDDRSFLAVQTPITKFVHTADELREAEYPVHPAAFTSDVDGELEQKRRGEAGQSKTTGWVDTNVSQAEPAFQVASQIDRYSDAITQGLTIYAIDCEMVQTNDDVYSLARLSIIDWSGKTVLDKFVKPSLPIKNYFTQYSGITPEILQDVTTTLADIQNELLQLLKPSTILLGHSLESDLNALKLTHPFIIDTSMIYPHPRGLPLRSSLKYLANKYLKREIQMGGANGHDSVEDARAVLDLVRLKCEKGPKWGTSEANGESIFRRLTRSGRTSVIVEYGTPERGLGREATVAIGCQNDDEVTNGVIRAVKMGDGSSAQKTNFVWGRLRDLETARGWNSASGQNTTNGSTQANATSTEANPESPSDETDAATDSASNPSNGDAEAPVPDPVAAATIRTLAYLVSIYRALPTCTLLILYSGTGDMRPVLRLQDMQRTYKREFKVKKWNELSVQWTDTEEQALRRAVEEARGGWGWVVVR